ncbi:hypothetical protein [Methylomonas sp. AM2-LC]|uniref:hypothetical protein n=1 Tax=Methylomonas sp. AM2-LC TaxID=3153301 RepID=UPI003264D10C
MSFLNLKIVFDDPYRVQRTPSLFSDRIGKTDIVIQLKSDDGGIEYQGSRYKIALILDANTGDTVLNRISVQNDSIYRLISLLDE